MNDSAQEPAGAETGPSRVRFEATIHPGDKQLALEEMADLDLDRVPDPDGGVRVLVTAEEATELVERGYEVRLLRALPVTPLDPAVVLDDESVRKWVEDRVRGIERQEGS